MSWSLHVKNGDLNPSGPGGLAVVTGTQKVFQDLKHWLLEPRGTDAMHPEFGSSLDGGRNLDGTVIGTNIGEVMDRERVMDIEAEIRRILYAYMQQQVERIRRESIELRGKNTLTAGELVAAVERLDVLPIHDVVLARVYLRVQAGGLVNLLQPVGS